MALCAAAGAGRKMDGLGQVVGHTAGAQPGAHAMFIRDFESAQYHGQSWETGYCPRVVFVVLENWDFVL